jgi:mannose-6-phosphate isomerase-like protein (cupin superfamily)
VPGYTVTNLKEDVDDAAARFGAAPDLEARFAREGLELEQTGLSYQRLAPNFRFPFGHTHKTQEEIYVVVGGSGRVKVDDDIREVALLDAVRVAPGVWRCFEAGPDGLEYVVFGAPNTGQSPREDAEVQPGWWAE